MGKQTFELTDEAARLLRDEWLRRDAKKGEQARIVNEAIIAYLKSKEEAK